jgi:hypothetical protein
VRAPKVAQIDVALQGRIHQHGTAATTDGSFNNRERQLGHSQRVSLDDVSPCQVASSHAYPVAVRMVARPRYRHFDDLWRKPRYAMPPRCGHPAGGGFESVTPDRGSHSCCVGEWAIVDKEHTRRATSPASGPDTPVDSVPAQSAFFGLRECDYSVMPT